MEKYKNIGGDHYRPDGTCIKRNETFTPTEKELKAFSTKFQRVGGGALPKEIAEQATDRPPPAHIPPTDPFPRGTEPLNPPPSPAHLVPDLQYAGQTATGGEQRTPYIPLDPPGMPAHVPVSTPEGTYTTTGLATAGPLGTVLNEVEAEDVAKKEAEPAQGRGSDDEVEDPEKAAQTAGPAQTAGSELDPRKNQEDVDPDGDGELEEWTLTMDPERYLAIHPDGPNADLARRHVKSYENEKWDLSVAPEAYLERYPEGPNAARAKRMIRRQEEKK